jgi:hypothetical protein
MATKTALIKTTSASEADCSRFETVTGIAISEAASGTGSTRFLVKAGSGNWQKYSSGAWADAATQELTAASVFSEGNTKAELAALDSAALAGFAGKKIAFAIAWQFNPDDGTDFPVTGITVNGQTGSTQTHDTAYSSAISLTAGENMAVDIIDITVDKTEVSGGEVTLLASIQDASGAWGEYVDYSTLVTTHATQAKAIRFKAELYAPTPGTSVAAINGVSIRHRTDNVTVFSEGTGVCITKTKNFVNTIGRAHAMIKHPIVKDTEVSVKLALREPPTEVKNEVLGVGDGAQHTVTLQNTENLASHGFTLYFDEVAQNPNTYSFSTADGQVTFTAPEGASVTCDYIHGWEAERFVEMVHDMVYPDADDNNLVDDQFDYIATNAGDPTGSVGTLRIEIKQNKGTVRDEVLGTGTGSLQAFVLAHHAKPETISVTPAGAEWTYREKTDTILVTAAAGAEIKASYDWAARTNYIESIGCIFNP